MLETNLNITISGDTTELQEAVKDAAVSVEALSKVSGSLTETNKEAKKARTA